MRIMIPINPGTIPLHHAQAAIHGAGGCPENHKEPLFQGFLFHFIQLDPLAACLRGGLLADMRHTDAVGSAMRVGEHVCPPDSASGIKEVLVLKESGGAAVSCMVPEVVPRESQRAS